MKTRTRVVAWIFLIFTAYSLYSTVFMLAAGHVYTYLPWYIIAVMLLWVLQLPFWIFLLRKQVWAWQALTVMFIVLLLQWIYNLVSKLFNGMSHPAIHSSPVLIIAGMVYSLIIVILPLWILLTDRPNMWRIDIGKTCPEPVEGQNG